MVTLFVKMLSSRQCYVLEFHEDEDTNEKKETIDQQSKEPSILIQPNISFSVSFYFSQTVFSPFRNKCKHIISLMLG